MCGNPSEENREPIRIEEASTDSVQPLAKEDEMMTCLLRIDHPESDEQLEKNEAATFLLQDPDILNHWNLHRMSRGHLG
jgi:hypothetical protein